MFDFKRHKCFWVYQNKTFFDGVGFLWSPQFAKDGKHHPGYDAMKEVKKGDLVFHSIEHAIVAISRAKSNCYSSPNPGTSFSKWDKEGWRIDLDSFFPKTPWIYSKMQGEEMHKLLPQGPFLPNGYGREQYLCRINPPLYAYVEENVLQVQRTIASRNEIDAFLSLFAPPLLLNAIVDGCKVEAVLLEQNKEVTLTINACEIPNHKNWIGKEVGDVLMVPDGKLSYRVERIYKE